MSDERPNTGEIALDTKDEDADASLDRDAGLDRDRDDESAATADSQEQLEPLLGTDEAGGFRERWQSIQVMFVDEPRQAVEDADSLVAELMKRLAQTFHDERQNLESQWSRGDDVSTEDLRVGLQRYRSFFERLLST
jgi:hypothetical protein